MPFLSVCARLIPLLVQIKPKLSPVQIKMSWFEAGVITRQSYIFEKLQYQQVSSFFLILESEGNVFASLVRVRDICLACVQRAQLR